MDMADYSKEDTMNRRLAKVYKELLETKESIQQAKEKLKNLEAEKRTLEDLEIVRTIRAMDGGADQIIEVLNRIKVDSEREKIAKAAVQEEEKTETETTWDEG